MSEEEILKAYPEASYNRYLFLFRLTNRGYPLVDANYKNRGSSSWNTSTKGWGWT